MIDAGIAAAVPTEAVLADAILLVPRLFAKNPAVRPVHSNNIPFLDPLHPLSSELAYLIRTLLREENGAQEENLWRNENEKIDLYSHRNGSASTAEAPWRIL